MKTEKKSKTVTYLLTTIAILLALIFFINRNFGQGKHIESLQKENLQLKNSVVQANEQYDQLTEQYETLNKEKNGSANKDLLTTTSELFKVVYNYNSEKKSDSVAARKEKSKQFAKTEALDVLFSKDADDLTPSVSTVSKLEGDPEVYRMSSDEKELTALVLINYSFSIAGSDKVEGKFMYKLVFDPVQKQVTEIKNIGEISIL
ncbi:hypothetical protein [Enterococcus hulanensis]|uniref:hypothetical protein n=1 Tax=Enterococcus hulanensis TaxID=2559929 RepID=UPI0010F831D0|nr:hypothetical protein [Enterococcus hulanensis]